MNMRKRPRGISRLLARLHVVRLEHAVDVLTHAVRGVPRKRAQFPGRPSSATNLLDGDARLVQDGMADGDGPGVSWHAVDAQRQQAQPVDLLHFVGDWTK